MSDLTDEELANMESGMIPGGDVFRALAEIRRHRAAQTASEERVQSVVRGAIREAVAIVLNSVDRIDIGAMIDAIATRAEKQLAGAVGLSDNDWSWIRMLADECRQNGRMGPGAALDRLLARSTP